MSRNSRRRKVAREVVANHGVAHKAYAGPNRETRRQSARARVADLPPLDDRRRQYRRAAARAWRTAA